MVATTGSVAVEVGGSDAVLDEVLAGGAVEFDGAGGGDVIGGDGVSEDGEAAGGADVFYGCGGGGHAVEVGSLADVGGVGFPAIGVARGEGEVLPVLVAIADGAVLLCEHVRGDGTLDGVQDFLLGGPDVLEEDGIAGLVEADGVCGEVVVDRADQGVRDDERGAHEVVGADFGGDAAFEVAISGEDRDSDEAVVFNRPADVRGEWAGVAYAGGAAVADDLEAEFVKVGHKTGLDVVVGDDAGTGS